MIGNPCQIGDVLWKPLLGVRDRQMRKFHRDHIVAGAQDLEAVALLSFVQLAQIIVVPVAAKRDVNVPAPER